MPYMDDEDEDLLGETGGQFSGSSASIPTIQEGSPMPNRARNPDDPREKLRQELMKKYGNEQTMMTPEYRQAERAPREALQDNNRDLAFMRLIQQSANQAGTIGGKAASSAPSDQYTDSLMGQNQQAMQGIDRGRAEMQGSEDRRLKLMQYLSDRYGKDEAAGIKQTHDKVVDDRENEKLNIAREELGIKRSLAKNKIAGGNGDVDDKALGRLRDDLDPNKARGGNMAKNQAQVDQADRLKGLYTEANGDIRNLDSRQMEELAIGLNKMLSGSSSGSVTQVQALLPHTAVGSAQKLQEWLKNDPHGANQMEFVKRMAETIDRERDIAADQVRRAQAQRLPAHMNMRKNHPDAYWQVLQGYGLEKNHFDDQGNYRGQGKKIKVTNGKEVLLIDTSDLNDAEAEGFKVAP